MQRAAFRAVFLLWCVTYASGQTYAGPMALRSFRVDRSTTASTLFDLLGEPAAVNDGYFCYHSAKGSYLWLVLRAHENARIGGVLLSDFPNCVRSTVQPTQEALETWKTKEGIGLGSTAKEVVRAYGTPSKEDEIKGTGYRWVIHGDYISGDTYSSKSRPELGDTVLVYATSDDLKAVEFGLRNGRVVWVFL